MYEAPHHPPFFFTNAIMDLSPLFSTRLRSPILSLMNTLLIKSPKTINFSKNLHTIYQ